MKIELILTDRGQNAFQDLIENLACVKAFRLRVVGGYVCHRPDAEGEDRLKTLVLEVDLEEVR